MRGQAEPWSYWPRYNLLCCFREIVALPFAVNRYLNSRGLSVSKSVVWTLIGALALGGAATADGQNVRPQSLENHSLEDLLCSTCASEAGRDGQLHARLSHQVCSVREELKHRRDPVDRGYLGTIVRMLENECQRVAQRAPVGNARHHRTYRYVKQQAYQAELQRLNS